MVSAAVKLIFVASSEISQQLLDVSSLNAVQTFMSFSGLNCELFDDPLTSHAAASSGQKWDRPICVLRVDIDY